MLAIQVAAWSMLLASGWLLLRALMLARSMTLARMKMEQKMATFAMALGRLGAEELSQRLKEEEDKCPLNDPT